MVPEYVSGRKVTKRGVHLHPTGHHGYWLEDPDYWTGKMVSMDISWAVCLTDSDGAMVKYPKAGNRSAIQVLLDAGIIPVIRFAPSNLPRHFPHMDHVSTAVEQCAPYGVTPIFQWPNEPGNYREWVKDVPDNWYWIFLERWQEFAGIVVSRGGIAGFPDGPCYDIDPFPHIAGTWDYWLSGKAIYLGHYYGLNRPPDYPYDPIQREGLQWTELDLQKALGPWYNDPGYNDVPLEIMNQKRIEQADPTLTAIDDDTCWRGFEKVEYWMFLSFQRSVPMALTEGGWTPGARAGGGENSELRYPKPTPDTVAQYTMQVFNEDTPMLFQCPWLLADGDMAGDDQGWPYDAWHGWTFPETGTPDCPRCKPVIRALQEPPNGGAKEYIHNADELIDFADIELDQALDLL